MLRQIIVYKKDVIYTKTFGSALSDSEIEEVVTKIKKIDMIKSGSLDFNKYKISYNKKPRENLIFVFITDLVENYLSSNKKPLFKFKNKFINLFMEEIEKGDLEPSEFNSLNAQTDKLYKKLYPKLAIVGYSGVGKTTITKLLRADDVPMIHIPTISGEIDTIQIGNLSFNIFDFAGQEEFGYLWKNLIKASDVVLVVTDSTPENIEKTKFFLELKEVEAPNSRLAIIGNKQDLPNAIKPSEIEQILGSKTYAMVANKQENRDKMIQIIGNILDLDPETDLLLETLVDEGELVGIPELAINENKIEKVEIIGERITTDHISDFEDFSLDEGVFEDEKKIESQFIEETESDIEMTENPSEMAKLTLVTHVEGSEDSNKEEKDGYNIKERLLGILKTKKRVRISYIEKYLKMSAEDIIRLIFDLAGSGKIEGEFNDDDTEFSVM